MVVLSYMMKMWPLFNTQHFTIWNRREKRGTWWKRCVYFTSQIRRNGRIHFLGYNNLSHHFQSHNNDKNKYWLTKDEYYRPRWKLGLPALLVKRINFGKNQYFQRFVNQIYTRNNILYMFSNNLSLNLKCYK